jgi:hypothetical protein
VNHSSVAFSVTLALSTFDTGQFFSAASASLSNSACEMPGTLAFRVSAEAAIFQPAPSCSSETSA